MKRLLTTSPAIQLRMAIEALQPAPDRIFLITDSNVAPLLVDYRKATGTHIMLTLPAGESSKNLDKLRELAADLSAYGATRRSLIIAAGGGVVTDLAGFLAAIFKRGIRHINVATTILGAVDAAIGGKTAVDFSPAPGLPLLKNELGAFHLPAAVINATDLFRHLSSSLVAEGYAEMLKTSLLDSREFYAELTCMDEVTSDPAKLADAVKRCARFKEDVVSKDPTELGLRRILNLGHTFGHAFESMTGVAHGVAVAHGLLCSLIMSHHLLGLPSEEVGIFTALLKEHYPLLPLHCNDYNAIAELISHDKKSQGDTLPPFVLLRAPGNPVIITPSDTDLRHCWETYRSIV